MENIMKYFTDTFVCWGLVLFSKTLASWFSELRYSGKTVLKAFSLDKGKQYSWGSEERLAVTLSRIISWNSLAAETSPVGEWKNIRSELPQLQTHNLILVCVLCHNSMTFNMNSFLRKIRDNFTLWINKCNKTNW